MGTAGGVRWWGRLPAPNRRWLLVNAVAVTVVLNFVVNAAIAWVSALGLHRVPVWGIPLVDKATVFSTTAGTFFFLPLVTTVLCSLSVRAERRRSGLPVVSAPLSRFTDRVPSRLVARGALFGALTFAALTPLASVGLALSGAGPVSPKAFILYAALLSVALGLIVTPVVALLAMGDARPALEVAGDGGVGAPVAVEQLQA